MIFQHGKAVRALILIAILTGILPVSSVQAQSEPSRRNTPLVEAVANARPAVVNLRGKKTLRQKPNNAGARTQAVRQVNGMGTGVIIDPSGYILTNFHVVEDVERIQVTLVDGTTTTGALLAHDDKTDLALIKIKTGIPLTVMPLGSSTDVMLAETVAALGNAYGYEDTVTRGIISEIGRTVQVSDEQVYHNLLQTDAPINPGNSGGPLINLDGEMIGINVAVRVGAQGIAFAIPVNDAMEVAAGFLNEVNERKLKHGIVARTVYQNHEPVTQVQSVQDFSPAETAGIKYGDIIRAVNGRACERAMDLQCRILEKNPGEVVELEIERMGEVKTVSLRLNGADQSVKSPVWNQFGAKVAAVGEKQLGDVHPNYSRGLRIEQVRPGSAAEREGLRQGDVLVAMNGWKTETVDNLRFVLNQDDVRQGNEIVFYIIRGNEPFYGNIHVPDTK